MVGCLLLEMFRTWLDMAPVKLITLDLLCWGERSWTGCLHRTLPTSVSHSFSASGQGHFPSEATHSCGAEDTERWHHRGCQRRAKPRQRFAERGWRRCRMGTAPRVCPSTLASLLSPGLFTAASG